MFSKIILATICSTAVSAGPVYEEKAPEPKTVMPGCMNLFTDKQSFASAALIDENLKST